MHVAYIHQHFSTPKGSTGTRSYEMSCRLIAAGHRVSMISGVNDLTKAVFERDGRVSEMDIDGIHVYCIFEPYSNKMGFARRVTAFGRFARRAADVAVRTGADLVFATSTPLTVGIPGRKAARKLGVPFVFEVRDLWPEIPIALGIIKNPLLKWYTQRLERTIYHAADRIIALSPGMKAGICRTGYPAERVALIPNGCDLELFRPSDEPLADDRFGAPHEFRLVYAGAHGPANGLDIVLDAAAELLRRNASGVRFAFIGDGRERERLIERSRREGTDRLISWVPPMPKEELAGILPRFDAGMMIFKNVPSFYYGTSPNKFFDYIAGGLAVLNCHPGWVADLIQANECGLVVTPDDPGAFADAVLWLRDHRDECRAMGRRGRQLAEREFARPDLSGRFLEVLERAHAEGGASRAGS